MEARKYNWEMVGTREQFQKIFNGLDFMNNSFISIQAEQLDEGQISANFKSKVNNFNQLISLGSAILQTYMQSAVDIIKQNIDEEVPDEIIQLAIMDALLDKIKNLLNIQQDTDNENAVDSFLQDILKGMNKK